jgi:hypothetical protein
MFFVEALRLYTDTCPCATVGTWEGSIVIGGEGDTCKSAFLWTIQAAHLLPIDKRRQQTIFVFLTSVLFVLQALFRVPGICTEKDGGNTRSTGAPCLTGPGVARVQGQGMFCQIL